MDDNRYRSIGETLELLKQEFPEITISKIRFLETQGLIAPERTTNGYRKFYDHDIERLSFVLRQQREQFLPLKVIKDRITEKEPGVFVLDPNKGRFAQSRNPRTAKFERDIFGDPIVGQSTRTSSSDAKPHVNVEGVKLEAQRNAQTKQRNTSILDATLTNTIPDGNHSANNAKSPTDKGRSSRLQSEKNSHITQSASDSGNRAVTPSQSETQTTKRPRLFALPSSSSLAEKLDEERLIQHQDEYYSNLESEDISEDLDEFPKNSFTAREIAEKADLSLVQLNDLVTYGLLAPTSIRGQQVFSSGDLELALLARQFAKYGLEARHLKMYKVSAEREASFLEQVALPILAKKNSKSRAKAEAALTQLGDIGSRFRTQLLERAIDKILNS